MAEDGLVRELLSRLFAIYSTAVRYTQKARARKFCGPRNEVKKKNRRNIKGVYIVIPPVCTVSRLTLVQQ